MEGFPDGSPLYERMRKQQHEKVAALRAWWRKQPEPRVPDLPEPGEVGN